MHSLSSECLIKYSTKTNTCILPSLQLSVDSPIPLSTFLADKKRGSTIGEFLFGRKNNNKNRPSVPGSRLQLLGDGKGFRFINQRGQQGAAAASEGGGGDPMEALKTKNAVYCALVLEEFLKELAAVAQEHAVQAQELGALS